MLLFGLMDIFLLTAGIVAIFFNGYEYFTKNVILFTLHDVQTAFFFSLMLVAFLVFLFSTPFSDLFFNFFSRNRKPIPRESEMLQPLLDDVQNRICLRMKKKRRNIHLRIRDAKQNNAFTSGTKTVVINRELYENCDADVLSAVIAHELGHIFNGDSRKAGIILILFAIGSVFLIVFWMVTIFFWGLARNLSEGVVFSILRIFFFFLFLLVGAISVGLIGIYVMFFFLVRMFGRRQEYRADLFAVHLGYSIGLMVFFDNIKNNDYDTGKWYSRFFKTHPKTILRIGRIEKEKEMGQYAQSP